MAKFSLTLLLLACSCSLFARAQDSNDEQAATEAAPEYARTSFIHPLTNMPGPSEDVETSFIYPEYVHNTIFVNDCSFT